MRKYLLALILPFICCVSYGQQRDSIAVINNKSTPAHAGIPTMYLGPSAGINNTPGFIGFDLNLPLGSHVSIDGGMGASTWGNKLFLGGKYYLRKHCRGWALGAGLTFNSGQENRKMKLPTVNGREDVTLQLKPQTDAFTALYHYWTLGRHNNRFYLDGGWAYKLHSCRYDELYGDELTGRADTRVRRFAPGGIMLGTGFSFCIRTKTPHTLPKGKMS